MNSVNIIGRITKDIEVKKTNSGKSVCSFSVAVQRDKDNADFIPCTAWEGTADNIGKYFHKGDRIGISGVLSTRTYEDKGEKRFVMEVLVRSFDFLNPKKTETPSANVREDYEFEESGDVPFEV